MGTANDLNETIVTIFGNKLRVRVSGLLQVQGRVLLVNHHSLTSPHFWSPPGGGCNFGESLHQSLHREFKEETGLEISIGNLICVNEYLNLPLHAVELFFEVFVQEEQFALGIDPEMPPDKQILTGIATFGIDDLFAQNKEHLHPILHNLTGIQQLFNRKSEFYTNVAHQRL